MQYEENNNHRWEQNAKENKIVCMPKEAQKETVEEMKLDGKRWDKTFQTIFKNFVAQSR